MALFYKLEWSEKHGRFEMVYLNQQADWIMWITWDPERADYFFDCEMEEAQQRGAYWRNGSFDVDVALEEARKTLHAANADRANAEGGND